MEGNVHVLDVFVMETWQKDKQRQSSASTVKAWLTPHIINV